MKRESGTKKTGGRAREQLSDLGSFSPRNSPSSIITEGGRGEGLAMSQKAQSLRVAPQEMTKNLNYTLSRCI